MPYFWMHTQIFLLKRGCRFNEQYLVFLWWCRYTMRCMKCNWSISILNSESWPLVTSYLQQTSSVICTLQRKHLYINEINNIETDSSFKFIDTKTQKYKWTELHQPQCLWQGDCSSREYRVCKMSCQFHWIYNLALSSLKHPV